MTQVYLDLAHILPLKEIAEFWEANYNLDGLLKAKGIDVSEFERAGISFGRPEKLQMGVYRFMAEVHHFHRGIYCNCSTWRETECRESLESHLNIESIMDYGFDALGPWERWQMMTLY